MKKNVVSVAFIAIAFLAASCQKEISPENVAPSQNAPQFTASIESYGNTKTTVERVTSPSIAYKTYWESTDQIRINRATYQATPDGTDATKATFTYQSGDAPSGTYKAYFPSLIYVGSVATLPATYTYKAGEYNMPMYAESSTTSLSFKNICAVLAVKVTSADISTLKAIKVRSDKAMYGAFTITDNTAVLTDASDATKAVVLASSSTLTLDETGTTFYIAVPAQAYSYLEIYLSSDGSSFTQMMSTKSKSGLGTLNRNTVYPIDYAVNAVQLWADGPFWATTNIGADASTDYGQYFAWGYPEGQTPTGTTFSKAFDMNNYPYKSETEYSDMAAANWGAGWSLPTADQIDILVNYDHLSLKAKSQGKCSIAYVTDGVKGIRITGTTDGYTSNSIFIPAAGGGVDNELSDAGDNGSYWSSEQYNSDHYAYVMFLSTGTQKIASTAYSLKYGGLPVRPVRTSAAPTPSTFLPGKFSVSATKKVQFTSGNLYWNGSAFKLESSQTAYPTSWDANHVGHFYWTNISDYQSGNALCMPYASSYAYSDISESDIFWCGEKNKLNVDGQSDLYTLSEAEWYYLLPSALIGGGRGTGDSNFKYPVKVNSATNCLVIAPDGYTGNIESSYSAEEWAVAELNGLVCLPATGYRYVPDQNPAPVINKTGTNCFYCSSTPLVDDYNPYEVYRLCTNNGYVYSWDFGGRNYGSSIRLVSTVASK